MTEGGGIDSSGILGVVRHPWYVAVFILLWAGDLTPPKVIINVILSAYLAIGTFLEERKLVLEFGTQYRKYQAEVSMFFPLKWLKTKLHRGQFSSPTPSYDGKEKNWKELPFHEERRNENG